MKRSASAGLANRSVGLQGAIHFPGDAARQPVLAPLRHGFGINEITGVFGRGHLDNRCRLAFEQGAEQFLEHDSFLSDGSIVPKG
ncbi:hypothetical protein D3C81_1861990 [compost metagenome]